MAEGVEDKDSLQYAEFVRQKHFKADHDFIRPGKIKDWGIHSYIDIFN